jgi:hypothetical protein
MCGCGTIMVPNGSNLLVCPKDRWYLRWFHLGRGHARLRITMRLVDKSEANGS